MTPTKITTTMTTQEKIDALKAYANENYNKGGFDQIVECWDQKDWEDFLCEDWEGGAEDLDELKKQLNWLAGAFAEREQEVRAEIW